MISSLLLGACVACGEPIFRHRLPNGRQISCDTLRRIDEALKASGSQPQQPARHFQIIDGRRDRDRQGGIR